MTSLFNPPENQAQKRKPTREEIETLCLLHAVGPTGCTLPHLTARLGLAPALVRAMEVAVEPLVGAGLLAIEGERVWRTDAGTARLAMRLEAL